MRFNAVCGLLAGGAWAAATPQKLPDAIIAGYTNQDKRSDAEIAELALTSVKGGVNVLFWSFMELHGGKIVGAPYVKQGAVTPSVVATVHDLLVKNGFTSVVHFISIGGWNVDHTFERSCGAGGAELCKGADYAASIVDWNTQMVKNVTAASNASTAWPGFAGMDWDIEGVNDAKNVESNSFNKAEYQIMLDLTKAVKAAGLLVSMVPAQSYFNCKDHEFNMSLQNPAAAMKNFTYAGRNAYVALYAACPECFDLVMVQLYEGWSQAGLELYFDNNITATPQNATDRMLPVLKDNMQCLVDGSMTVDLSASPWPKTDGNTTIAVPASKVVIGLASGSWWKATGFKFPYFEAKPAGQAYCAGVKAEKSDKTERIRGFAYWDVADQFPGAPWVNELSSTMCSECNVLCSGDSSSATRVAALSALALAAAFFA